MYYDFETVAPGNTRLSCTFRPDVYQEPRLAAELRFRPLLPVLADGLRPGIEHWRTAPLASGLTES